MLSVFIDGEAGTTGLQIRQQLAHLPHIELRSLDSHERKDPVARLKMMAQVDLVILCLHDMAAIEAVAMINGLKDSRPRIIDASTAHRCAPDWVYGFPELCPKQSTAIQKAMRVSNPGCYATGAIALIRPLIDAGIIPADFPLTLSAVSGYSGGGRPMIEAYETGVAPPFEAYALSLSHKHIPEIMQSTGLTRRPLFVPSVGNFRQGMLVQLLLHLDELPARPRLADLQQALTQHYASAHISSPWVQVLPLTETTSLNATHLVNSNQMELHVFGSDNHQQAVLIARLDNLGKGASGAAVQNLRLMLGV